MTDDPSSVSAQPPPATIADLIGDLSEWSCEPDVCGIYDSCDACKRRERAAKLLAERDRERRPCTMDCTTAKPCERCKDLSDYLTMLFREKNQVAFLLRAMRQLVKAFPDEFRDLLADPVCDIVNAMGGKP